MTSIEDTTPREVVVLAGPGAIGTAIARRVGTGRHLLVADLSPEVAETRVKELSDAGFAATPAKLDLASRDDIEALVVQATRLGAVTHVINAAGVSPSQAPMETILRVDLYGTAVLLEEFGKVIAPGGSGVVISSQSGHRLPGLSVQENEALAMTPVEELLGLEMLAPERIGTTLRAYQISKRCNTLRVAAQAIEWGRRGARLNSISPGIVMTPLAADEINGPRGEGYRRMLELAPAGRAATPDEIAALAEFLMGPSAGFITGIDVLADGGATAAYWYGDLRYLQGDWAKS
ncbi:SDR family oxidoreductase [[Pseudopropionibacterium] massiliense]|uniref:SDR family oxidoreductase n=1 Tax=[Pseudopropionibacterium] massiliense TaxID=2220000 RepID=UPI001FE4418B|nr:SDR family oxidoreductase [[Pseudopropionibacterium] massiliense]